MIYKENELSQPTAFRPEAAEICRKRPANDSELYAPPENGG